MAATRFARSEAISQGRPMQVWVSPDEGTYGVSAAEGYWSAVDRDRDYALAAGLEVEIPYDPLRADGEDVVDDDGVARLVFRPDGVVDSGSTETIILRDTRRDDELTLMRHSTLTRYVIDEEDADEAAD